MADLFNRTLIIRLSSVGDVVLSSLLVRTFRKKFPSTRLDFLVKEEYAGLLQHNPHLHEVLTFPRDGSFADLRRLRRDIQKRRYDVIIDIHDSMRSRLLCVGAARVLRIKKRKLARFLLVTFKWNLYDRLGGAPPVALRYLETVHQFAVEDDGLGLELFFLPEANENVQAIVNKAGFGATERFIGLCPAAKHGNKMWPHERFAVAGAELVRAHGLPVMLFGVDDERALCEEIARGIKALAPNARTITLAGRLSLPETAAAMDRCVVVLTNDSGLMHMAAARKRPVVAVFGPTVRELGFFPFGTRHIVVEHPALACRPCTHIGLPACPQGHFKCMNEIAVPQVVDAAERLLKGS